jgi:hypothetical protein
LANAALSSGLSALDTFLAALFGEVLDVPGRLGGIGLRGWHQEPDRAGH